MAGVEGAGLGRPLAPPLLSSGAEIVEAGAGWAAGAGDARAVGKWGRPGRREQQPPPGLDPPAGVEGTEGAKGAGTEARESRAGSMSHGFKMAAVEGEEERGARSGREKEGAPRPARASLAAGNFSMDPFRPLPQFPA